MRGFSTYRGSLRKAAWLAAGLTAAAVLLAGWTKPGGEADPAVDTALLLARTGGWFAAAPAVTLRFCSVDLGAADAARLRSEGERAAARLGLRGDSEAAGSDAASIAGAADANAAPSESAAYRAAGPELQLGGAGSATLLLAGGEGGRSSFLIVKLDAAGAAAPDALLAWQRDTARALAELGVRGAWNAQLQGPLAEQRFGARPEALLDEAGQAFQAKPLEAYKDEGTYSVSYGTKLISRTVRSGKHEIGLQAALHRDTGSGNWRLTVGVPLITSEY